MDTKDRSTPKTPSPTPSPETPSAGTPNLADRPAVVDRRTGLNRRNLPKSQGGYDGPERRVAERLADEDPSGLHVRRGPGVRRSDDRRAAEEGEMTAEQFEFVMAVEAYKKANKRMYPTWTEILEVFSQLGYRKVLARTVELINVPEPQLYTGADPQPDTSETTKKAA